MHTTLTFSGGNNFSVGTVDVATKCFKDSMNSSPRNSIAREKFFAAIAAAIDLVYKHVSHVMFTDRIKVTTFATASTSGTLMTLFSARPIIYDGVSGVASKIALTASRACNVGYNKP